MKRAMFLGTIVLVVLAVVMVSWKTGSAAKNQVKTAPQIGYIAPDFTLTDINGKKVTLSEVYSGNKVTVLNFWATWCPPCRAEIPELSKLYQKYRSQKLALLAVDLQEASGNVKNFAADNGMKFSVLLDGTGEVGGVYQVYSIPSTFILDRNGRIRDVIIGSTNLKTLEVKIQPLLREK